MEETLSRRFWRYTIICLSTVSTLLLPVPSALAQTSSDVAVTFAKDVAPILQEKCQACHRPGQMGPMSLVTYQDARPWARLIKARVAAREMPPWHIDRTVGIKKFANDPSLTDEQIDTIVKWVDAGAPLGNPKDLPAPVQWPSDAVWRLAESQGGPPDHIVKTPTWTQAAVGADQWWSPVVPTGLTEDRWIRAVEVKPSPEARRIIHHGNSRLAEFAPGKAGEIYPGNTGKLIKADEDIAFDIHSHSVGEEITAQLEVGLWFYPKGEVPKYQVKAPSLGLRESLETFDLPPGKVSEHWATTVLPEPTKILSYQPHMHTRGKAMTLEAIYPNGRSEVLSHVDRYNFNWQINYVYADDVAPVLPKGTILRITAWHDNTAANKLNPDPTQWVSWGERSYDEMMHTHIRLVYITEEDYTQITEQRKKETGVTPIGQQ